MGVERIVKRTHVEHGWFNSGPRSYEKLIEEYEQVQLFSQSFTNSSRSGYLYALEFFLNHNNLNPTEALKLSDSKAKTAIRKAILKKQEVGSHASGRRIFYSVKRFYELHDRELYFNPAQKKLLLKWVPKKVAKQHVPSKSEIYRVVDAVPRKDPVQQSRSRATILCLWQSGVRSSCLCSWKYGMFKDKLNLSEAPLTIKIVANRDIGTHDVGEDTKLSGYKLSYYFTFLNREAVEGLRGYIESRKKHEGWIPKDSDYIFVTAGTVSRGKRLNAKHLNAIVKTAFEQIGIDPESIWTHVIRKSFRKILYRSGVDPDVSEALMGHKLSQSKTSYFDFKDVDFLRQQYASANWARLPIRRLEETVSKLEINGKDKDTKIKELENQLTYFRSPKFVEDLMNNIKETTKFEAEKPSKPKKIITKVIKIGDKEAFLKLNKEGYALASSDDEYFVMEKEE